MAWDKDAPVRNLRRLSGLNGHSVYDARIGIDYMVHTAWHFYGSKCNRWKEPSEFSSHAHGDLGTTFQRRNAFTQKLSTASSR